MRLLKKINLKKPDLLVNPLLSKRIFCKLVVLLVCSFVLPGCLIGYKNNTRKQYQDIVAGKQSFDAVIVPGIPHTKSGWSALMKARVIWSWILYKNGIARNIIYSGAAVYTPYCEAFIMGLYAQKLGIPREHIFYDTSARHSTENVYYSYLLAEKQGFGKIALATDFYQSFYLNSFIKKHFQTPICPIPFIRDSIKRYKHIALKIDPRPARIREHANFLPLTEKESYLERLKGTLGKKIHWGSRESHINLNDM